VPATFTATVTAPFVTPTGSVTFSIDGVGSAPITLAGSTATFTGSDLAGGDHTVVATYSGDNSVAPATATLTYHVNPASTTITLSVAPGGPVLFGAAVTFTTVVSSNAGTPSGDVVFSVDGTPTTVTLAAGQAVLVTSALSVGPHTITAS